MSFHTQLGLDVDWANGKSLYVRHLQGSGAVEEWNRQNLGCLGPAGFLEEAVHVIPM